MNESPIGHSLFPILWYDGDLSCMALFLCLFYVRVHTLQGELAQPLFAHLFAHSFLIGIPLRFRSHKLMEKCKIGCPIYICAGLTFSSEADRLSVHPVVCPRTL